MYYGVLQRSARCTFSTTCSEATPPASTTTTTRTATATAPAVTAAPTAASPATRIVLFAVLWLGRIVHKERIEWERVGEHKIPDIVAANRQGVERNGVAIPRRHLDRFQVCVHLHIDTCEDGWVSEIASARLNRNAQRTCDRSVHYRSVFELDGYSLVIQLHQKPLRQSTVSEISSSLSTRREMGKAFGIDGNLMSAHRTSFMVDRARKNYRGVQGRCRCRARQAKAVRRSSNA